jgi:hypothetical protein
LPPRTGRDVHQRRQDKDADVEEHRDAQHEAGDAHGERRALLAEDLHEPAQQHFRAAGPFQDGAEHRAEADDHRDVAEDAGEALLNEGITALGGGADQRLHRDSAHQGHDDAGSHQGDERLELDLDDQEQQEGDARPRQEKQAGGVVPQPVKEFIHGR